jgi:putative ABC transport system ATP-binding protein
VKLSLPSFRAPRAATRVDGLPTAGLTPRAVSAAAAASGTESSRGTSRSVATGTPPASRADATRTSNTRHAPQRPAGPASRLAIDEGELAEALARLDVPVERPIGVVTHSSLHEATADARPIPAPALTGAPRRAPVPAAVAPSVPTAPSTTDPPLISLRDVSRRYGGASEVAALEHTSLEIRAGEFVCVLGASGSGKTTLLNLIGALDQPSSGEIRIAGRKISGASGSDLAKYRRESVSFIFQTFNLFPALSALENVEFGANVARRRNSSQAAVEMLNRVGLGHRLRHFPHALSGGEQQRVAIARALATGNPIVLADEPTGELDFRTGLQILELLQSQAGSGRVVIVVTHNREIARVADRVIELSSGHVIADRRVEGPRPALTDLHW